MSHESPEKWSRKSVQRDKWKLRASSRAEKGLARRSFRWSRNQDFGSWTRQIVQSLVLERFDTQLSLASIGAMLARLGLTAQKPLQRAYQRDPQAIEQWQRVVFPSIAAQARREGAEVFFWDESGFRADAVHGKTWARRGQTPVVERPGQRQSISAASAVNSKGAFWFQTYAGALTGELFVELLRKMMYRRKKPVHRERPAIPS